MSGNLFLEQNLPYIWEGGGGGDKYVFVYHKTYSRYCDCIW